MKVNTIKKEVGRIGQRYQVVIPKSVRETLNLANGDFVEFDTFKNKITLERKVLVEAEYTPTPTEAKLLRKAMGQLKEGKSKPWAQVKHELGL